MIKPIKTELPIENLVSLIKGLASAVSVASPILHSVKPIEWN